MDRQVCGYTGKRIFHSVKDARRTSKNLGNRLRVYRCADHFHITDQEKR